MPPWKGSRIGSGAAVLKEVFELWAAGWVGDGAVEGVSPEPLAAEGTGAAEWVLLELGAHCGFALRCRLPDGGCRRGPDEGKPLPGKPDCPPVELGESLLLEVVAHHLIDTRWDFISRWLTSEKGVAVFKKMTEEISLNVSRYV